MSEDERIRAENVIYSALVSFEKSVDNDDIELAWKHFRSAVIISDAEQMAMMYLMSKLGDSALDKRAGAVLSELLKRVGEVTHD